MQDEHRTDTEHIVHFNQRAMINGDLLKFTYFVSLPQQSHYMS